MPKNTANKKIIVIGGSPIIIGQAADFCFKGRVGIFKRGGN